MELNNWISPTSPFSFLGCPILFACSISIFFLRCNCLSLTLDLTTFLWSLSCNLISNPRNSTYCFLHLQYESFLLIPQVLISQTTIAQSQWLSFRHRALSCRIFENHLHIGQYTFLSYVCRFSSSGSHWFCSPCHPFAQMFSSYSLPNGLTHLAQCSLTGEILYLLLSLQIFLNSLVTFYLQTCGVPFCD